MKASFHQISDKRKSEGIWNIHADLEIMTAYTEIEDFPT
jgi:hypothetical protein